MTQNLRAMVQRGLIFGLLGAFGNPGAALADDCGAVLGQYSCMAAPGAEPLKSVQIASSRGLFNFTTALDLDFRQWVPFTSGCTNLKADGKARRGARVDDAGAPMCRLSCVGGALDLRIQFSGEASYGQIYKFTSSGAGKLDVALTNRGGDAMLDSPASVPGDITMTYECTRTH